MLFLNLRGPKRLVMTEMWRQLYNQNKREKKQLLKRNGELEYEAQVKKMKIRELKARLALKINDITYLRRLNQLLVQKNNSEDASATPTRSDEDQPEEDNSANRQKSSKFHNLRTHAEGEEEEDCSNGPEELNRELIAKERQSNEELQEARKELIAGLIERPSGSHASIGIKRMGEIDDKVFKNACRLRFPPYDAEIRALELCSLWQEKIRNPQWHPFLIVEDEKGNPQKLLMEDDEKLKELKDEWGETVYKAVTAAMIELNEYNPSGCYSVPELWNFKENRKATLKEVIQYNATQMKPLKVKRKTT